VVARLRALLARPVMEGFPVVVALPVQWGDMDALSHVNNARYFTWFEGARIALFRRVGLLAGDGDNSAMRRSGGTGGRRGDRSWLTSSRTAAGAGPAATTARRIIDTSSVRGSTVGPILARATCDFLKPVHYPLDIVVGARVTRVGNTSFTIEYAVAPADEPANHLARGTPSSSLSTTRRPRRSPFRRSCAPRWRRCGRRSTARHVVTVAASAGAHTSASANATSTRRRPPSPPPTHQATPRRARSQARPAADRH